MIIPCPHKGNRVSFSQHKEPLVLESSTEYDSLVEAEVRRHGVEI